MEKKTKWAALAVGAAALCVLLVYGVRLAGPRSGIVDGHLVHVASFSPLLFGLLLGLALHLTGALRRDIAPLEWLPALLLCIPLWMHSESPAWFTPYPENSVRLSTLLLALVGIGCVDAALGVWQKRGWRFRWKAALALALLAFLVAASEWPGDAANAVRSATMDRSAAARYIGVSASSRRRSRGWGCGRSSSSSPGATARPARRCWRSAASAWRWIWRQSC